MAHLSRLSTYDQMQTTKWIHFLYLNETKNLNHFSLIIRSAQWDLNSQPSDSLTSFDHLTTFPPSMVAWLLLPHHCNEEILIESYSTEGSEPRTRSYKNL